MKNNVLKIKLTQRMIDELKAGASFDYEEETKKGENIKILVSFSKKIETPCYTAEELIKGIE